MMDDRRRASRKSVAWTLAFAQPDDRTPTHGYGDARGRDGGIRKKLAAGVAQLKLTREVEATSIVPSLNGKTARSWRGIVPFTHLAREGRMTVTIGRRELLAALGGAVAAWPLAAQAQQPAMPVIGFLHSVSPDTLAHRLRGFRQGLKEAGFVEGENVAIEQRWAENQMDRLPALAADLVRRRVSVIAAIGPAAAFAAKAANTTIPIVFGVPDDPVRQGLVSNLARPGGNLTGINFFTAELTAKRLGLLRELLPAANRVAVLVNPTSPDAETTLRDVEPAARAMGLQIRVLHASTSREINEAFATFVREQPDALFVAADPFFQTRRVQLVALAARHAVPAAYSTRDYAEASGLMSYGTDVTEAWRQVGVYTGRILKGAKPADLPVVQSSKFELVINAETARMLGISVPDKLLVAADEVIE